MKNEPWYWHEQWVDVSCIPKSGCCCIFVPLFVHFFIFLSLQFSNIIFFVTLLSRTVRPRRLKLYTHVDNWWMYGVYRNQTAALIHPFNSSFFFLYNFHPLQFFVTLFLRNCEALKVETWYTRGQRAYVVCIQESGCCCIFVPLLLYFSFSPIFKH